MPPMITMIEQEQNPTPDKIKDEFMSMISHEMRTPLTIIRTALGNLKDGVVDTLTPKQAKVVDIAIHHIHRLNKIISDLLDLSRLESGKSKISRSAVSLNPVIQDTCEGFSMLAKEKSINLKIELPESLDPVYSDTDLFAQVLTNLLSNALRYAKSTITIAAQNVDKANYPFLIDIGDDTPIHQEGVRLSVQDDGIGIPQAYLTKIFDKFVQVNRPSGGDGYKGTGLGLAICKKIVDLHHGRIWVENLPEGGAIFHVFIPIYNEQADFIAALKEMVEESKKINTSLSMVVVRITNMDNIRKKCTPDLIDKLFLKLKDELQVRILRKSDQLFHQPTKDLLIILALTGHDGAQSICRRTLELISIFVAKQKDPNFDPTIKTGFATYPEDTDQSRSLLEKALANIK